MANIIKLKRKTTTGAPTVGTLAVGEVCVNQVDEKLYYKKDASTLLVMDFKTAVQILANATLTGTPTAPTPPNSDNSTKIATTAFVKAVVGAAGGGDMLISVYDDDGDGKVNAAETADALAGVEASNYALKTYVDNAINGLINGAPGALDTLIELADALGNDPNFAASMSTLIGEKLDDDSIIDGGEIA